MTASTRTTRQASIRKGKAIQSPGNRRCCGGYTRSAGGWWHSLWCRGKFHSLEGVVEWCAAATFDFVWVVICGGSVGGGVVMGVRL